jgi:hypothetical protein
MTSILSTVSGQFGKAWILGALLPAALFVTLGLVFVQPLLPIAWQVVGSPSELDTTRVLAVSFVTLLLSGLLFHLNIPILRFYEGYPWQEGWLGQWRTRHYEQRFDATDARWRGMRTLLRAMPDSQSADFTQIYEWWSWIGYRQNRELPGDRGLVLPTRFGNVMRSFEDYPRVQYGIDAIALWPHLFEVIDTDQAALIEDEKIGVDFMLNSSFLMSVLAVATLIAGLADPFPLAGWQRVPWQWLVQVTVFAGLGYLFYLVAINRAEGWGTSVRAAFDLNRSALLQRLGYQEGPTTPEVEKLLWERISQGILRRQNPGGTSVRTSGPAAAYQLRTFVQGVPPGIGLDLWRGVDPETIENGTPLGRRVVVSVRNADKRKASKVVVTDTLPEGFDLRANSAKVEVMAGSADAQSGQVTVLGTNPYQFEIGDFDPGQQKCLSYEIVKQG